MAFKNSIINETSIIHAGHSTRGRSILNVTDQYIENRDNMTYPILSYANGPGVFFDSNTGGRRNVSGDDFNAWDYHVPAAVPRASETHGEESFQNDIY